MLQVMAMKKLCNCSLKTVLIKAQSKHGYTAWHAVARYGRQMCLHFLIDTGAYLEAEDEDGHDNCLGLLIERGANRDSETKLGLPALDIAIQNGHAQCCELLK